MRHITRFFQEGDSRTLGVKKNAMGSLLMKGISIFISLMLIPLTLGYVSAEIYGVWLTLSSITLWFGILDAGFSLGLKNKLAESIALGKWEDAKKYVSTTYALMIAIFVPICIILLICIHEINWPHLLNTDEAYRHEIELSLGIIIICFCMQMILGVINAILAAKQKVAVSSFFYFIGNILSLVVIFILTKCVPPSLFILSFVQAFIPVFVILCASICLFLTRLKQLRPAIKYVDITYVRSLFGLGYKFFILQIQVLVVGQTTNFLISYVSGPTEVTSYNIAYRYLGFVMMTFLVIIDPLWPAFTDAYTKKDFDWMQRTYSKMSKVRILLEAAIIVLILISPFVYQLWIGAKASVPLVMTIAVGIYFMAQLWMALNITLINGIGCIQLQTYFAIFVSIVHVPLSLFLGGHFGALGVVISLIVLNLVYAFFSNIQIKKVLSKTATGIWVK